MQNRTRQKSVCTQVLKFPGFQKICVRIRRLEKNGKIYTRFKGCKTSFIRHMAHFLISPVSSDQNSLRRRLDQNCFKTIVKTLRFGAVHTHIQCIAQVRSTPTPPHREILIGLQSGFIFKLLIMFSFFVAVNTCVFIQISTI